MRKRQTSNPQPESAASGAAPEAAADAAGPVTMQMSRLPDFLDLSRSKIYDLLRDPDSGFPRPTRVVGRTKLFSVADVRAWGLGGQAKKARSS